MLDHRTILCLLRGNEVDMTWGRCLAFNFSIVFVLDLFKTSVPTTEVGACL